MSRQQYTKPLGMWNIGNKCYMNAAVQFLFCMESFKKRYLHGQAREERNGFNNSMCLLANGLFDGKQTFYPGDFNKVLAQTHAQFATFQQHDALECFLHIIRLVQKNNENLPNPCDDMKITLCETIYEGEAEKMKQNERIEYVLPVPIMDIERAEQLQGSKDKQEGRKQKIGKNRLSRFLGIEKVTADLKDCISIMLEKQEVQGLGKLSKKTSFYDFPQYLVVAVRKFILKENGKIEKRDVQVQIPSRLDISDWKSARENEQKQQQEHKQKQQQQETVLEVGNKKNEGTTDMITSPSGTSQMDTPIERVEGSRSLPIVDKTIVSSEPENIPQTSQTRFSLSSPDSPTTNHSYESTEPKGASSLRENITPGQGAVTASTSKSHPEDSSGYAQDGNYTLKAFVRHIGFSHRFGHYNCYIRMSDKEWLCCDDSTVRVKQISDNDINDGYFYLYEKDKKLTGAEEMADQASTCVLQDHKASPDYVTTDCQEHQAHNKQAYLEY